MKRAEQNARASFIGWMLRQAAAQAGSVYGPATLWLYQLNSVAPDDIKARADWPKSPEQLARTFAELSEGLAALGVTVTRTRAKICGTIHRVWRVSVFTPEFSPRPHSVLLAGRTHQINPIEAHSAEISPTKAESGADYSDFTGAPQMPQKRRKTMVEECARITAHEAPHVGAATVETQIGGTSARRLWAVCGECERAVCFLYQLPDGEQWKCQKCHQLTTRARRQRGTKAEFEQWLTFERWEKILAEHPAAAQLHQADADDWRVNVAAFDLSKISAERRAELLEFYANDEAIKHAFRQRRAQWNGRAGKRGADVSELIRAEVFEDWKQSQRSEPQQSRTRPRDAPPAVAATD